MNTKRYALLDFIRGFTLINMILYHAIWDLVYLFGFNWQWYQSTGAYVWQQAICWTFILLSGFCWSLGRHPLKRGLIVFGCGLLITVVTVIAMPQDRVVFGILTFIGSCMLLMIPMDGFLSKIPPLAGLLGSLMLFVLTRNMNTGSLGFESWSLGQIPSDWYANLLTTFLGFPAPGFMSTDYFSLFPWFFLYITGYFLYNFCKEKDGLNYLSPSVLPPVIWLGKHSLVIYMLHQPVLYALGELIW